MRCSMFATIQVFLFVLQALLCSVVVASTTPQPVQVDFGPDFLGNDGLWSPAQIRVGTKPEQWLLLLPNTLSSDTWVIGPAGCDASVTCRSERGGLFYWNQSSTWDELGYFDLGYNDVTDMASIGQYGLDNVSVSDTIAASEQSIAIVNSTSLWVGEFGLNVKETRFDDSAEHSSFISTLVQNLSLIPSHSYGYTAGAPYAFKGVPGSLTLGGVDSTRFAATSSSFSLSSNYEPIIAITSIKVGSAVFGETTIPSNWAGSPVTLLEPTDAFTAVIDSSTPFLWMPSFLCDAFASALNLTYDANLDLYVFEDNSSAQILKSWGLTFTFTVADLPNSTTTFNIPISYNAFNLQLSYPFPGLKATSTSPAVDYFPLRRANSTSQYTIGRAFLQETYLTVDYERSVFSLFPAVFPDLSKDSPNLVPISRPAGSSWPGPRSTANHSLSTDAKAGIGIGSVLALLLMGFLVYLWFQKKKTVQTDAKRDIREKGGLLSMFRGQQKSRTSVPELFGDKQYPKEMYVDISNSRYELGGEVPSEMPAGEVPSTYYESNHTSHESATARTDSQRPAELGHCESMAKGMFTTTIAAHDRSQSPVPPYTPPDNVQSGQMISSYSGLNSISNSNIPVGSESSGEQGISPITPSSNSNRPSNNNSQSTSNPASLILPSGRNMGSQHNTGNIAPTSHLSPRTSIPQRTVSRSSRFREELVDEPPQQSTSAEEARLARARYSWEASTQGGDTV